MTNVFCQFYLSRYYCVSGCFLLLDAWPVVFVQSRTSLCMLRFVIQTAWPSVCKELKYWNPNQCNNFYFHFHFFDELCDVCLEKL